MKGCCGRYVGLCELILSSSITFSAGCHQGPPHYTIAPASDGQYPTGEAVGVYRAVLHKLYLSSNESPPFVVLWDSTQFRVSDCWKLPCSRLPAHHSEISRETMRAYERATLMRAPMRGDFGFELPIVLFSEGDRNEIEGIGKPLSDSVVMVNRNVDAMPFWLGFRKRYPGAWGYVVLTRVGFDPSQQHALVQVTHRCGSSCVNLEEIFLEKSAGEWRVAERMLDVAQSRDWLDIIQRFYPVVWDGRDSVVFGSLRYLGPNAHYLADYQKQRDSLQAWIRDSVSRDALPRRIRGTVTYKRTGLPLSFAELVAHVAPNDRRISVVADSLGRYELKDSPIGGTMLEVQCPGAGGAPGKTLDAPGLYVHAAIDSVINMVIPDIEPCWDQRRVYRLQSGWLESAEARSASYPTPEAAAVYRSVLGALRRTTGNKNEVFVLADTTRERCVMSEDCGSLQLALLLAEGLVDSSTVRNFLKESRLGERLRPHMQYGVRTVFLTRDERDYLSREGDPLHQSNGSVDAFWNVFSRAFPNSPGVVSFTRVGFNRSKSQALVEMHVEKPPGKGDQAEMMLLERDEGVWRVALRNINRRVTSGTLRAGRCVPTLADPRMPAVGRITGLKGNFAITEVETARGGRVSHFSMRLPIANSRPAVRIDTLRLTPPKTKSYDDPRAGAAFDSTGERIPELRVDLVVRGGQGTVHLSSGGLDGYLKNLHIRRVSEGGFFGNWESSISYGYQLDSGRRIMPNPSGYFCATPIPAPR